MRATEETDAFMKSMHPAVRYPEYEKQMRKLERERDAAIESSIERFTDLKNANTELAMALETVIVLATENPDMLVMHILASDSPIRRVWERHSSANAQADTRRP